MKAKYQLKLAFLLLIMASAVILVRPGMATATAQLDLLNQTLEETSKTVNPSGTQNISTTTKLPTFVGRIVNGLFALAGVIFLALSMLGGVLWMTAGGNEEKVKRAQGFIFGGVNGMIIMFFAYAMVYLVLQALNAGVGS
ncbi:MAG: hypothetical protein RB292_04320 [Patescibacteria group bacterium]|jgi:hypothetical protein|nr:hypothetical protein [Patescibacteria group bacterium]